MLYAGIAVVAGVSLYLLHALFLWMEDKGWVYYWHRRGTSPLGNVFMPIQAVYQPEVNYVLEERAHNEAEQDESGGPPSPEYDVNVKGQENYP